METLRIRDGKIALPSRLLRWLEPNQELVAIVQGDTLILKKLRAPRLSEIASRSPTDVEMPLEEIAKEVHLYRQEKRRACGS